MSQPARTVPKFASFKPKVTSGNNTLTAKDVAIGTDKNQNLSRENARIRDEHKRSSHGKVHERGQSSHALSVNRRRDDVESRTRTQLPPQYPEPKGSDIFYSDVRGDAKIVQFGSLDRHEIPVHRSIGYGRIIGAPAGIKIDYNLSDHGSVMLREAQRSLSERPLKSHRARSLTKLRLRYVQKQDSDVALQADFIALTPGLERKRSHDLNDDNGYRSISGKAKPSLQPDDADLQYIFESDTAPLDDTMGLRARRADAEISHRCKEEPQDLENWFALIHHQVELVHPRVGPSSLTNLEKQTLAEMRVTVYEQAMKHFDTSSLGYGRLVAGWLKEGNLLWEPSKLMAKWKEVLQQCPEDPYLWRQYLDLVQGNDHSFHYQQCKAAYAQCLELLYKAAKKAKGEQISAIKESQVYVFLRFTAFTRDAGYTELAFAMWQIVLENASFSPEADSDVLDIESLEAFWESDAPRIGEQDARSWRNMGIESNTGGRQVSKCVEQHWEQQRLFRSFCEVENAAENRMYLPGSSDEDEEFNDDPFRTVFFSDLREILPMVLDEFHPRSLFNAFLAFMRFPPLHGLESQGKLSPWQADPYLSFALHRAEDWRPGSFIADHFPRTRSTSGEAIILDGDRISSFSQFVMRAIDQLQKAHFDHELAEYSLNLKAQFSPSDVQPYAKRLSKARPHDLRLYNTYAIVELQLPKLDKARSIWKAALSIRENLPSESRKHEIVLWHSWTRAELTAGNDAEALYRLLSVAKTYPTNGSAPALSTLIAAATDRLRAAQHFQEGWIHMLESGESQLAILHAVCMAWLIYLTGPYELPLAIDRLEASASTLLARSADCVAELLHEAKADLLRLHVERKRAYKPTFIRETLTNSLRRFPNNSHLLSFKNKVEENVGITDRMRVTLQNRSLSPDSASLTEWQYALSAEIRRSANFAPGSTPNSVRATFSRAMLSSDSLVKHSRVLWEMWFTFEKSRVGHDGESALRTLKKVFLDGLRFLPWYKQWVVEGLGVMEDTGAMTRRELMQVYDVLGERGLRVRYGPRLEELLEHSL